MPAAFYPVATYLKLTKKSTENPSNNQKRLKHLRVRRYGLGVWLSTWVELHQDGWDQPVQLDNSTCTCVNTHIFSYALIHIPMLMSIFVATIWVGFIQVEMALRTIPANMCEFISEYTIHCMNTFCWLSDVESKPGWVFPSWSGPLHVCPSSPCPERVFGGYS